MGEEQEACLREVVAEMDVAALISVLASEAGPSDDAPQAEDAAQFLEMMAGLLRCLPELLDAGVEGTDNFADGVVDGDGGPNPGFLERAAARLGVGEFVEGVLDYDGDVDYFVFEAVEGELYEVEVDLGTLPDSFVQVYNAEGFPLDGNDDRGDGSLASRLVWRAPVSGAFYVAVSGYGEGSYSLTVGLSDIVDDYADGVVGAARLGVGEPVDGVLDYERDVDYFVFEAVEGELYEIGVALVTLDDSMVAVYDQDGVELGWNDDVGDGSLASLVLWRAPASRDFFVEVSGYGEGSYSMTVGVSDIVDDFADGVEGAARLGVGEPVDGVLDYERDVDYFVFEAVEGELYEVEVNLGTLSDSVVEVYNADGLWLGYNDDREYGSLASLLVWRALQSGDAYVGVSGYGEGSYTLTVAVSDIVDDHPNLAEGAAAVEVGKPVEGVLEYAEDVDVFVLGAVEGELYEIDVTLGTLADSIVVVYDSDGFELAWNDDHEGSLASHVEWRAPLTGDFYVEVSGYGEGSYTLAVEVSE